MSWWSITQIGTPFGSVTPVCDSAAASTIIIPPILDGQLGESDNFLNGASSSSHSRLANLPTCLPHANNPGFEEARAMAEPIVSISPFLPARTGTAPRDVASAIHSANFSNFIPQEIV